MIHPGQNAHSLAVLLPAFAPDLSYLATWLNSSVVILDDLAPWSRKSHVHRTKVRTPNGISWIHIPIHSEDKKKPIHMVRMDHSTRWIEHHLKTLWFNYRNSIYFDFYEAEITADYKTIAAMDRLLDACVYMTSRWQKYLELDITYQLKSTHREPDLNAFQSVYHEPGSTHFQHIMPPMKERPFSHPVYYQHFGSFIPGCGLFDVLFENGPDSYRIIDQLREPSV